MIPRPVGAGFKTRKELPVDRELLRAFDDVLNPASLEAPGYNVTRLDTGKLSVVFQIEGIPGIALKRLPPFPTAELRAYHQKSVDGYQHLLNDQLGLPVVDQECIALDNRHGEFVLYIAQTRQPQDQIGSRVIAGCNDEEAVAVIEAVLELVVRVWFRNKVEEPQRQTGLDAQISNWVIDLEGPGPDVRYLDTATPFFWRSHYDMVNPDVFLRRLPEHRASGLRKEFREVMNRYYDLRTVLVDLLADLIREGQGARTALFVAVVNRFMEVMADEFEIAPITLPEVEAYYRADERFWRRFNQASRFDRFIKTRLLRRRYPYILPDPPESARTT